MANTFGTFRSKDNIIKIQKLFARKYDEVKIIQQLVGSSRSLCCQEVLHLSDSQNNKHSHPTPPPPCISFIHGASQVREGKRLNLVLPSRCSVIRSVIHSPSISLLRSRRNEQKNKKLANHNALTLLLYN